MILFNVLRTFRDLIGSADQIRRKKMVFMTLGIVVCLPVYAESGRPDQEPLMPLPVPQLPIELLAELSTRNEPLIEEASPVSDPEVEIAKTVIMSSRPLRITAYTQPTNLIVHGRAENPPIRQGIIPGVERDLTQEYILRYSTPKGLELLDTIMHRGSIYFAFIRKEVEARKLPMELMYLPVIESGFLSSAVSKSGATGLWQFMKNSISPYDMKITDWMDERMDFWKATMGALSKLEENYRQLKDWPLALAAYNSGLGGVSRIMQRTGISDYWELSERKHLQTETIHYVPKLLAISHIMSNPRYFGIEPFWHEDPEWTRIQVGRMVDLDLVAAEAGIDKRELKRANSELFYNVTPPDPNYYLKVRAADAPAVSAVLERKDLTLIKYYFHTVASGETLSELAQHYGVAVDTILKSNPGVQARYLKIGARLLIPAYKDVGPYQPSPRTVAVSAQSTYQVKRGDTLWSIAKIYRTTPEALARVNNMRLNDVLREGKQLKIR